MKRTAKPPFSPNYKKTSLRNLRRKSTNRLNPRCKTVGLYLKGNTN